MILMMLILMAMVPKLRQEKCPQSYNHYDPTVKALWVMVACPITVVNVNYISGLTTPSVYMRPFVQHFTDSELDAADCAQLVLKYDLDIAP